VYSEPSMWSGLNRSELPMLIEIDFRETAHSRLSNVSKPNLPSILLTAKNNWRCRAGLSLVLYRRAYNIENGGLRLLNSLGMTCVLVKLSRFRKKVITLKNFEDLEDAQQSMRPSWLTLGVALDPPAGVIGFSAGAASRCSSHPASRFPR